MLVLGLMLLIKGSDFMVEAASRIAKKLGVPEFFIGLTLVALGTSLPELASSIAASSNGYDDLILGNLIGSNMANIGLVLGISAIIATIKVDRKMLRRDGYIMIGTIGLFFLLSFTGMIKWYMGVMLLLLYFAYIMFLVTTKDSQKESEFGDFVRYFFKLEYLITIHNHTVKRIMDRKNRSEKVFAYHIKIYNAFKEGLIKDLLIIGISAVAIIYGADYLVGGAIWLAGLLNISSGLIGMSIVAIGTSLPELSVSITAGLKKFGDISVGNILGSNIANILLVMGASSIINPISIDVKTLYFLIPFTLFLSAVLVALVEKHDHTISRKHGIALLVMYIIFMSIMFWMG